MKVKLAGSPVKQKRETNGAHRKNQGSGEYQGNGN